MFICNFIDNIFILHAISTESGVNLYSTEFVDDEEDREKSPHFSVLFGYFTTKIFMSSAGDSLN
jgi:hypothetical protein